MVLEKAFDEIPPSERSDATRCGIFRAFTIFEDFAGMMKKDEVWATKDPDLYLET